MTYQQLIDNALAIIGVTAAGESASASDNALAFSVLQNLIDGWKVQQVAIYKAARLQFTLTGAQEYTIGPTSLWNTGRPIRILGASIISSNGASQPVKIVGAAEFAAANAEKAQNGLFADVLYCDYAYPNSIISFSPIPQAGGQVELFMWQSALNAPSAASDLIDLPPSYTEALQYNLAVRLAAPFGRSLQGIPEVVELAASLKNAIGVVNASNQNPNTPPVATQQQAAQ